MGNFQKEDKFRECSWEIGYVVGTSAWNIRLEIKTWEIICIKTIIEILGRAAGQGCVYVQRKVKKPKAQASLTLSNRGGRGTHKGVPGAEEAKERRHSQPT